MSLLQALRDAGTVETMSASLDALLELMGSSRSGGVHDAAEDARHAVEGYRWLIDRIRGGGQVRDALRGLLQPPPPP